LNTTNHGIYTFINNTSITIKQYYYTIDHIFIYHKILRTKSWKQRSLYPRRRFVRISCHVFRPQECGTDISAFRTCPSYWFGRPATSVAGSPSRNCRMNTHRRNGSYYGRNTNHVKKHTGPRGLILEIEHYGAWASRHDDNNGRFITWLWNSPKVFFNKGELYTSNSIGGNLNATKNKS